MEGRTRALAGALGALALFGLLVTWFDEEPGQGSSAAPSSVKREEAPRAKAPLPLPITTVAAQAFAEESKSVEHDELELGHPHPITERHRKIRHENNLRALLNDAVRARNAERVRDLVREYRLSHPDDPNRLQAGYEVLAECLANPSDAARLEAARYYEAHRSSILRRSIRRVCLEG